MDARDRALLEADRNHAADLRDPNIARMSRGPGPNEIAIRQADARRQTDEMVSLYGKFLGVAEKTFKQYLTRDAKSDAALAASFRGALEETAKAEAIALVGKMPYGKVIMTALELSNAFAAGIGQGIEKAHAKARIGSGKVRTPEEEALYERGYLARATGDLSNVLLEGMATLSDAVVDLLFKEAGAALKSAAADVAGQIAKQLPRHHDVFAIINADVKAMSSTIPHGRAGVERITFSFASNLFVRQYGDEELAKRMSPILEGIKSKEPVDVALTGGLLQVIFNGSYRQYKRFVHVDRAEELLRTELKEQARSLLARARTKGATVEIGTVVETAGNRIVMPKSLIDEIESATGAISEETYYRALARETEYWAARNRFVERLADIARAFQRRINERPAVEREAAAVDYHNKLVDLRAQGLRTLKQLEDAMVAEFGEEPDGYGHVRTHLTYDGDSPQQRIPILRLEPLPWPRDFVPLRDRPRHRD